jgi:hypothetical protein
MRGKARDAYSPAVEMTTADLMREAAAKLVATRAEAVRCSGASGGADGAFRPAVNQQVTRHNMFKRKIFMD